MPAGRPTKYKKEYAELAYKYCLLDASDIFLAEVFEVNIDTIYEWKNKHPSFSDAIKNGKHLADAQVSQALINKAKQGDTAAMIFWLKNRNPTRWRDKPAEQSINITNNVQNNENVVRIEASDLTTEQLQKLLETKRSVE